MLRTIESLEAALQAHSFRVFLFGVAGLVLIRTLAWFLDRPLRSRTGAGYARDAQLTVLGVGAMATSLAMRVWLPEAFAQGLLVAVAATAVAGVAIHRAAHPPVAVALGSVFQAVFVGTAYLMAWPFLAWLVGAWAAYNWLTSPSAPADPKSEDWLEEYIAQERRIVDRESASQHWQEEEARRQARDPQPQVGQWPF